jgi:hypothetical protein
MALEEGAHVTLRGRKQRRTTCVVLVSDELKAGEARLSQTSLNAVRLADGQDVIVAPEPNLAEAERVLLLPFKASLTAADVAGKTFIVNARKRLSKFLGEVYSTEWGAAGWPDNSTGLPSTQEDRFNLVASLQAWFTSHQAHESVDMDATAALAGTTHAAISSARAALDAQVTANGVAKNARDAAEQNLRKRMNGLVSELATLLTDDDPRWHTFGLSRPADESTPEAPTLTTVAPGVAGTLLVDWDDPLRADHYRVWIQIVGTDTDFHAVQSVNDSDATLSGLPTGATVKVQVTSVNDAGESLPGPVAQAVVG